MVTKKSDPISKEKILVLGWKTRITALLSGVLLTIFALTMTMALGIKAPLDFSVFSAAGGALLLGMCTDFPFSLDELVRRNRPEAPHAFAKAVVDVDRF